MKKLRFLSVIMAIFSLLIFSSCSNSVDSFTFPEENFVNGTLHEISITENLNRTFVVNQYTDYSIVVADESSLASKAAGFIVQNVKRATGATLSNKVYYDGMEDSWTLNDKLIVLNAKPIFEKAGLSMPNKDLGQSGYYIKTVGNTVFIMCQNKFGYQMGAIKFLEATLGYDMLGSSCWYYGKEGKSIPDMEIVEKPDFDFRTPSNDLNSETAYGMGFNFSGLTAIYMTVSDDSGVLSSAGQHTSYRILPPSIYGNDHPSWYFLPGNSQKEQLCYTARGANKTAVEDKLNGVENEYNLMVETAYEKCMRVIDDNPDKFILPFTGMDNNSHCECEHCLQVKEDYGAISATNIMFLKDVDDLIQNELERRALETNEEKRVVYLTLNAYNATMAAPAFADANGNYHPIDDKVVMSSTMAIDIAPIESYYNTTFYSEQNMKYGESKQMMAWAALSQNMFFWLYNDNFLDYFSPYNTYDSQIENYRFCYEIGGVSMFNQGQVIQIEPTNFTKFKEYINSKAYINVNVSYKEVEDNFFNRYFLDAKEPMYNFFKEMQAHLEYLEDTDVSVTGKIYNPLLNSPDYFSLGQLRGWLKYVDQAYDIIEKYASYDQNTYNMLKRNIMIESLFPRYGLLRLYSSTFTPEQELAEKLKFKKDCHSLGNRGWGEGSNGHLTNLWNDWGV